MVDISILKNTPRLSCRVLLTIKPLSPLSMVNDLPGSYYKSVKVPTKKMICGLLENMLGWHISAADRQSIIKDLKDLRKKQSKEEVDVKFIDYAKGSTYTPLLMDYFEIESIQPIFSKAVFYNDLWSKGFRRSDSKGNQPTHAKGTFNIDQTLIKLKRELPRDSKNQKQVDNTALGDFYSANKDKYPFFYSTPTNREYISMDGQYEVTIDIDINLLELVCRQISINNIGYLGNTEGWVDLKIIEV